MQERQLDVVVRATEHPKVFSKPEALDKKLQKVADANKKALPDYERTPTAEELKTFYDFGVHYKKLHKQAKRREIRKAIQEHFHIRIYK